MAEMIGQAGPPSVPVEVWRSLTLWRGDRFRGYALSILPTSPSSQDTTMLACQLELAYSW